MNFLTQGFGIGRWFGIQVTISWLFVLYMLIQVMGEKGQGAFQTKLNLLEMVLLFGTVLLHEFGHALSCRAVGGKADRIVLWPLGGIAFVQPPMNPLAWLITTLCGPLVNAVLWPVFYFLCVQRGLVGHAGIMKLQMMPEGPEFYVSMGLILMWQINKALLLFNLIPAYPMDGGRILQEVLWFALGLGRSLLVSGMIGIVAGAMFAVLGLGLWQITLPGIGTLGRGNDSMLLWIGLLCAVQSFGIYRVAGRIRAAARAGSEIGPGGPGG